MQQINLYLPEFRPRQDWLSAERVAIALGILFAILLAVHVTHISQLAKAEKNVLAAEAEQSSAREQAESLKKAPRPVKDPLLEQEVVRLRAAIHNREGMAEIMSGQSLGNEQGFSRHLLALGRHKVEGVSLENFALRSGGAFVRLEGVSQKPELVPLYVTQLQSDINFSAAKFGFLSMNNQGSGVRFLLSGDGPMAPETLTYFTEGSDGSGKQ